MKQPSKTVTDHVARVAPEVDAFVRSMLAKAPSDADSQKRQCMCLAAAMTSIAGDLLHDVGISFPQAVKETVGLIAHSYGAEVGDVATEVNQVSAKRGRA